MAKFTLYSTNCPKCKILEKKLEAHDMDYEIVSDVELMKEKGFLTAPMLEYNNGTINKVLNFNEANRYIQYYVQGKEDKIENF